MCLPACTCLCGNPSGFWTPGASVRANCDVYLSSSQDGFTFLLLSLKRRCCLSTWNAQKRPSSSHCIFFTNACLHYGSLKSSFPPAEVTFGQRLLIQSPNHILCKMSVVATFVSHFQPFQRHLDWNDVFTVLLIEGFLKILAKPKQNVFFHSSTPSGKDSIRCVKDCILFFPSIVYVERQTVFMTNAMLACIKCFISIVPDLI